jgi:hypothetical protein
MKIKPQPPRSCLGWFAWVFGSLLVLFAISYAIDMIRLLTPGMRHTRWRLN